MEKTQKITQELFPNLHGKTITGISSVIAIITYFLCKSGIV